MRRPQSGDRERHGFPVLELRSLFKRYRSGEEIISAVDGVSLTVEAGQLIALLGPSGSGKTTLLLLAAGIIRPDGGEVRFDGRDLAAMSKREATLHRRRDLGFVFQSFHLQPGMSALDNAAVKLVADGMAPQRARERVAPLLEQVGLDGRGAHVPERLSGGERQRVAIARALAHSPRLVLADEPTGNLDSERGRQVLELLSELCRERGVAAILVTHDARAAQFADTVMTLTDGRLAQQRDARGGERLRRAGGPAC